MFKHANRGALPAMLVLGVLIGAGLAVATSSPPNRVLPSARPPVLANSGAPSDDGVAKGNPHAPRPVDALTNGHGNGGKVGRDTAHPGVATASGEWNETDLGGSDGNGGPGGSEGSGGTGGADTGSGGSGGGGSGGSGSTGGGKGNNGKAKGHHDGKGNNG